MKNIIVVGSSYFERYVEQIETANLFPQAKLFFVSDHGNSMNIDIGYLIDLIKKEGIQAIVLGPFDYERVEPYVDIPCYVVQPNIQDFLLLHNKVENYQKAAVVLSRRYEIDLTALEESLHIRYNKYYYPSHEGVSTLIAELKRQGFMEVIGNSISVDTAQKMGLRAHYYFSRKCIEDGISNALQIIRNLDRENQHTLEIRSLLESTTCGVISTDADLTISYANKTALDTLCCQRDRIMQKPLTSILPAKLIARLKNTSESENNVQLTIFGIDVIGNIFSLKIGGDAPGICFMFEKASRILEYETMIRQESKRKSFSTRYSFSDITGHAPALLKAIESARRFAMRNSTVLINAETGSGKELFAQSIHDYSPRRNYPFVAINCASIPDTLIESELFGYTANSFTGASSKGKSGLIEMANHGTVFLDDVDALSANFQSKLLRVMQEHEIIRIGGTAPIPVDVRFIVATNRNLREMVEEGTFRNDLYFRINILHLELPPLRNRPEDIPLLYEHYLKAFDAALFDRIRPHFHETFASAFAYHYPGNVRELINVAERVAALAEPERADDPEYLSSLVSECLDTNGAKPQYKQELSLPICGDYQEDIKRAESMILQYYKDTSNCSMTDLAQKLGISRATLYNRLSVGNRKS